MTQRISEAELATVDLHFVKEVLLAGPGEQFSGVPIYEMKLIAPFASRSEPSEPSRYRQLIVEVEDPDSPETIERLRTVITERMRNR